MPTWDLQSLWFQSACNKELRAPDKHFIEKVCREVFADPDAREVFNEVSAAIVDAAGNISTTELLQELGKDHRWETCVERALLVAKSHAPTPQLARTRWRELRTVLNKIAKSEGLHHAASHAAGAAIGAAVSVTVAVKLISPKEPFNIPVTLTTPRNGGNLQLKVGLDPQSFDGDRKIPLSLSVGRLGLPNSQSIHVPLQFDTSGVQPLKLACVGSDTEAGIWKSTDIARMQSQLSDIGRGIDALKPCDTRDMDTIRAELKVLREEEHALIGTTGELVEWKDEDSRRLQTANLTIPDNSQRDIRLPVFDGGRWTQCDVTLTTARITKVASVTVRYTRECGGNEDTLRATADPSIKTVGDTRWTIALDSLHTPLVGMHYATISFLGVTNSGAKKPINEGALLVTSRRTQQ